MTRVLEPGKRQPAGILTDRLRNPLHERELETRKEESRIVMDCQDQGATAICSHAPIWLQAIDG